jgi:hypothetical protein
MFYDQIWILSAKFSEKVLKTPIFFGIFLKMTEFWTLVYQDFLITVFISPFMSLTGFSLGMNIFHFEAFPLSA